MIALMTPMFAAAGYSLIYWRRGFDFHRGQDVWQISRHA
jgi:hypothetical protein